MRKHTPGPWAVKHTPDSDWQIIAEDGYSVTGISDDPDYGRPKEDVANARLIAAAPEMLETLTWIRDHITGLPAVARALAEKVIAKAEGRS